MSVLSILWCTNTLWNQNRPRTVLCSTESKSYQNLILKTRNRVLALKTGQWFKRHLFVLAHYMCICKQMSEMKVRLLLHWTLLGSTVSEEVTKCLTRRCLFLICPVIPIPAESHFWFIKTISLWILNYEMLKLLKELELRDLPTLWNLLTKGHISLTIQSEAGHPWC